METKIKEYVTSYASALNSSSQPTDQQQVVNLKDAIESARTEELKEEQYANRRSNNLIIHGVKHQSNENLQEWIKEFTNDTHTNVTVKHISRIGKDTNKQPKPLIVVLKNEDEKEKLLSNLTALKGLEKYKGISVLEDLTPKQRMLIKNPSDVAKKTNAENQSEVLWKVRGSTKNGFRLIKVNKMINQ